MSDLNDFTRSDDVIDPTACAWPAREIAAAEASVTAGTDRYMRVAAHAVARAALCELRQGRIAPGAAVVPARPVYAPFRTVIGLYILFFYILFKYGCGSCYLRSSHGSTRHILILIIFNT